MSDKFVVSILDYGAGNVRSLRNAVKFLGFESKDITTSEEILQSQAIMFPGQGSFKQAMKVNY
jgi:glutamine amidotransferase/cyclase